VAVLPTNQAAQQASTAQASLWSRFTKTLFGPTIVFGLMVAPPLLFCLIFFPHLTEGHPPALTIPYLYVILTAPVLAPIGLVLSLSAAGNPITRRWLAISLAALFLVTTLAMLFLFARSLMFG